MYIGIRWAAPGAALIWLGSAVLADPWQTPAIIAGNVALVHGVVIMAIEWRVRREMAATPAP
ncbi:hypothetical protein [Demequina litorisediminis]|nr:hypothetical protein [Demequina litorisediminis]